MKQPTLLMKLIHYFSFVAISLFLSGCITPMVQDITFAEELSKGAIKTLQTENFLVHYPEGHKDSVLKILSDGEFCLNDLKKFVEIKDKPINVIFIEKPIENAYYFSKMRHVLLPLNFITNPEDDAWNVGLVFCHELAHYVHGSQISGIHEVAEKAFGKNFLRFRPQDAFESWVWEGIAIYYESKLNPQRGRLNSHFWRQVFESQYAHQAFTPSDLFSENTDTYEGAYLTGSHFIEYLAKTYGEDKIWSWVKLQGDSLFWPIGVGNRFEDAFGVSLSQAIQDFSVQLSKTLQKRQRPIGQKPIAEKILNSQLPFAAHPRGLVAYLTSTQDQSTTLTVVGESGAALLQRPLTDVVPPRVILSGRPVTLFFSEDGSALFINMQTSTSSGGTSFDLYKIEVASGQTSIIARDSNIVDSAVSRDGKLLYGHRSSGAFTQIIERPADNPQNGRVRILATLPLGYSLTQMTLAPDGSQLAFLVHSATEAKILQIPLQSVEVKPTTGITAIALPQNTTNRIYGFSFLNNRTLVYARPDNTRVQVYSFDLSTGKSTKITDAPYLALNPKNAGKHLVFMNREVNTFSLDQVNLPAHESQNEPLPAGKPVELRDTLFLAQKSLPEPAVKAEGAYSKTDGLFKIRNWFPSLSLGSEKSIGATFGGHDDLYLNAWTLHAKYLSSIRKTNFGAKYANLFWAPTSVNLNAEQNWAVASKNESTGPNKSMTEHTRSYSLDVSRPFFDSTPSLSFISMNREVSENSENDLQLTGPSAGFRWHAARDTNYSNEFALAFSANVGHYSKNFGSKYTLSDYRSEFAVSWQPPFSTRHELQHKVKGRAIENAPQGRELLRVGGATSNILPISSRPLYDVTNDSADSFLALLPQLRENAPGFEDVTLSANKLIIAENSYQYVIPVNTGAVYPYFLPSLFLERTSLRLFSSQVFRDVAHPELAIGSIAQAHFKFSRLPFDIAYQYSVRPKSDKKQLHLLQFGLDI